jgi:hypothetical protein
MINFKMFTHQPTDELLQAIEAAGITVRGWEIPNYRFSRRKTMRNSVKTERGWTDPTNKSGNLNLTVEGDREGVYGTERDPQVVAFHTVLKLAATYGVHAANGGMASDC